MGPIGAVAMALLLAQSPGGPPRPTSLETPSVLSGSVDLGEVARVARRNLDAVSRCSTDRGRIVGRLAVEVLVNGTGAVVEAALRRSTLNHPRVEECVVEVVRKWRLPPAASTEARLIVPFRFMDLPLIVNRTIMAGYREMETALRGCYAEWTSRDLGKTGVQVQVPLRFEMDEEGRILSAEVIREETGDFGDLDECVVQMAKSLRGPRTGKKGRVRWHFWFPERPKAPPR